jgi:hypothetical protein
VASGRTEASRAVLQPSSRTGRQMPAVTSVGPQSQPKLAAIFRTNWNGSGYAFGRGPSSACTRSASVYAEVKCTRSAPPSRPDTSNR